MLCIVSQNDQLLLNTETVDNSCVYSGGLLYEVNHRTTKVLARGVFLLSQPIRSFLILILGFGSTLNRILPFRYYTRIFLRLRL